MKHLRIVIIGLCTLGVASASFAQSACRQAKLTASDGAPFDSFGRAVAISSQTALIGAMWNLDNGPQSGSAYVFGFDPRLRTWTETQLLLASDGDSSDHFGAAVAIQGETALIGAFAVDGGGAAYVFRLEGSSWIEEQKLLARDREIGDHFGRSVALRGDLALIGAPRDDDNGINSGSAYVLRFDPDTGGWMEEQKLLASDGGPGDGFGFSVAVSGNTALVGAGGHNHSWIDDGSAYVFRFDPNTSRWVEEEELLASDAATQDEFGISVSISGDAALIGAHLAGLGSAYVFRFDPAGKLGSQWPQEQKLTPSGGLPEQFGKAVAIDGDAVVIGAWVSDTAGPDSGAAYVYRYDPSGPPRSPWVQQEILLPEPNPWTNFFGFSVALDGQTALIGAHGEDQQAGAAYVFDVAIKCNCPHDLDLDGSVGASDLLSLLASWGPCKGCPADFDENGTVGASDLLVLLANWGPCP